MTTIGRQLQRGRSAWSTALTRIRTELQLGAPISEQGSVLRRGGQCSAAGHAKRPGGKGYAPGREPPRRSGIRNSPRWCLKPLYWRASPDHSYPQIWGAWGRTRCEPGWSRCLSRTCRIRGMNPPHYRRKRYFSLPRQDIEIADNLSVKIYTGQEKGAASIEVAPMLSAASGGTARSANSRLSVGFPTLAGMGSFRRRSKEAEHQKIRRLSHRPRERLLCSG